MSSVERDIKIMLRSTPPQPSFSLKFLLLKEIPFLSSELELKYRTVSIDTGDGSTVIVKLSELKEVIDSLIEESNKLLSSDLKDK